MRTIKVGLDIGNSSVKGDILTDQNTIIKSILMPSAINTIVDEKYLHFANRGTSYLGIIDSPLEHVTSIIAIGDTAMDIPNYQQYDVGATSYKTNHEITTALLLGIISEVIHPNEDEIDVLLAVSIPIVESKTFNLAKEYRSLLEGSHVIRIYTDGQHRDVTINIISAHVVNEGQAGFLGLFDTVDQNFKKSMTSLYTQLGETASTIPSLVDFLVVDIGEGTTDLAVFRNKKFNPEYSYSITKGYGNLLEQAMANAERSGLTIESRKQLQELLSSDNPRRQEQRKIWEQYVETERTSYIKEVAQTILKAYGRQSYMDAIIFLGGGFSALTGYSVDEGGSLEMVDSSLFDNLDATLSKNNKTADLVFGIPEPYSQSINRRGLMQILSSQQARKR